MSEQSSDFITKQQAYRDFLTKESAEDRFVTNKSMYKFWGPIIVAAMTVTVGIYIGYHNLVMAGHNKVRHIDAASEKEVDELKEEFKELKHYLREINRTLTSVLRDKASIKQDQKVNIFPEVTDPLANYLTSKMREIKKEKENESSERIRMDKSFGKVQVGESRDTSNRGKSEEDS